MEYHRIIPDNKVAIIDAKQFEEIEKLSELNKKEIESRAKSLYKSYLKNTGIDVKIKYLTDKNILYNGIVRICYNDGESIRSSLDPYSKQIMDDIKDIIVDDANKKLFPIRKEIIEGVTSKLNRWEVLGKRWFKVSIVSNIIWLIICAGLIIMMIN